MQIHSVPRVIPLKFLIFGLENAAKRYSSSINIDLFVTKASISLLLQIIGEEEEGFGEGMKRKDVKVKVGIPVQSQLPQTRI